MDHTVHRIHQARILEWVAFPFSRGSSSPRDWIQVSHFAGGFFTNWAIREAQEYWSGQPTLSPGDLPDPGIEPGSPALQADSLQTELWGKSCWLGNNRQEESYKEQRKRNECRTWEKEKEVRQIWQAESWLAASATCVLSHWSSLASQVDFPLTH